ncbi:hypothetical protein [Kutzneria sp. CA-103260]|uniref:hypothetical protein n=1 Tax=Kutzneria sp. CA-103260 TaxID=2802641 RepID=UPI001BAB1D47|nr:hypothetical protein [Kutzneria sp. CA-103260]QUQ67035.1 hypothetical protein JJ691_47630 [Kutzneria sp. CA-103260]
MTDFLVLGSGSLARVVCYSLAAVATRPIRVTVVGRDASVVGEIGQVSRVRAATGGNPVTFRGITLPTWRTEDLASVVAEVVPDAVLLCASTQSPWEGTARPSAWTEFTRRAGFGVTLPFHVELAEAAARAVAEAAPDSLFLNAAFPDAVNPVLSALGIPVFAGIGNVAVLAAAARARLAEDAEAGELAMLAHHLHLHAPANPDHEAVVYVAGKRVPAVPLLEAQRRVRRQEANQVTGLSAARTLFDVVGDATVHTHLPGPMGRPGGYPVTVGSRRIALRLPAGVTEDDAVAANQVWAEQDSVSVERDRIRFTGAAATMLPELGPDVPVEFPVRDLAEVRAALSRHRELLRGRGPDDFRTRVV